MKLIYDTIKEALSPWPHIDDKPVIALPTTPTTVEQWPAAPFSFEDVVRKAVVSLNPET